MRKIASILFIIILLLTHFACTKTGQDKLVVNVPVEFILQPWEKLSPSGSTFALLVRTVEVQKCSGTGIKTTFSTRQSALNISILNTIAPQTCDNQPTPASDTIELSDLKEGTYTYNINLKELISNTGELVVDSQKITIRSSKREEGISFEKRELNRIPEKTVWGYIGYSVGQETKVNEFLDKMKKMSQNTPLSSGDYGHFQYFGDVLTIKNSFSTTKPLINRALLRLNSPYYDCQKLIKDYRLQGLDLKFFAADGSVF